MPKNEPHINFELGCSPEPFLSSGQPEEVFKTFFMSSPIGIYIVQKGKFQLVNPEFQKSTGYTDKELIGMSALSLVVPEHRATVRSSAVSMLKGQRRQPYEFKVLNKKKETRWIIETVTSISFRGGKAALGNFLDITERKRAEAALSQSEELYRSVIEQAVESIYLVDAGTRRIIEANPAFQSLLGYSLEEMKDLTLYDYVIHDRRDIDQHIEHIMVRGEHVLGERRYRRKDGTLIDLEVSANAINYGGRKVLCVVTRDISERKQAEREKRFLTQRLIGVAEEERKKISRDLHDEMGQPLTALHFNLDSMQSALPEEMSELKFKCAESLRQVERIGDCVRDMLFELRPPMLDDLGLVPTLEWYIHRRHGFDIKFKARGFKKRLSPDLEIILFRLFQECMNNIIKHARAYHVEISLTYSHPSVIFMVKDDGVGFNSNVSTKHLDKRSSGIGLLGMRERVESVGGEIKIKSSPGKGTVVWVEIADPGFLENERK